MSKKAVLEMLKNAKRVKAVYVGFSIEDIPNMDKLLKEKYPERKIVNHNDRSWYVFDPNNEELVPFVVVPNLPKKRIGMLSVGSSRYSFLWIDELGRERSSGGDIKSLIKVDDKSVKIVCFNGDEIIYSVDC